MNATTRSTTSCGPATWRHSSSSARPSRATVDLNSLQRLGVRLVGRLAGVTSDGMAQFSGSLPNQCALADLKLGRLLDTLDEWATSVRVGQRSRAARAIPAHRMSQPTLRCCFL